MVAISIEVGSVIFRTFDEAIKDGGDDKDLHRAIYVPRFKLGSSGCQPSLGKIQS